jgi:hypothetical protein
LLKGALTMIALRKHTTAVFALVTFGSLAAACSSSSPEVDGPTPAGNDAARLSVAHAAAETSALSEHDAQRQWGREMSKGHPEGTGCFRATHPAHTWEEVPCDTRALAPVPYPPPRDFASRRSASLAAPSRRTGGSVPRGIVADTDWETSSSVLRWAQGSFPSGSVASETSSGKNSNPGADSYSLQVNTQPFTTSLCNQYGCNGWDQFVYDSPRGQLFVQHWLLVYAGSCPGGWNTYVDPQNNTNCWQNSAIASVPSQPASGLPSVALSGQVVAGGSLSIALNISGQQWAFSVPDLLGLAGKWTDAEFNVFGENGGAEAVFTNSSLEVQLLLESVSPTTLEPSVSQHSETGEFTNMKIGPFCAFGGLNPGVQFFETTGTNATGPACPTIALDGNPANDNTSVIAGTSMSGKIQVVGQLVDAPLTPGTAPQNCQVTGVGSVVNNPLPPVYNINVPPTQPVGTVLGALVACDTGKNFNVQVTALADPFLASPNPVLVKPGGPSETVQWYWAQSIAQFCEVPTYQLISGGNLPSGVSKSLTIDGLLTLTAASSVPLGTYTLLARGSCGQAGTYEGAVTVEVTNCLPATCHPDSCQGAIPDGCGGTVNCPTTCSAGNHCVDGYCEVNPPPPPPLCNGVTHPTTACTAGWVCCSKWTCAKACLAAPADETASDEEL